MRLMYNLLLASIAIEIALPLRWTLYRGISDYHSNKVVKITSVMKNLKGDLNFKQLRLHRKKPSSAIVTPEIFVQCVLITENCPTVN